MTRTAVLVTVGAHALAALTTIVALRFFLTPPELIGTIPERTARYAMYAFAIYAIAFAAGSVLGLLISGRSWWPAIYLWAVAFAIVLLPVVSVTAAHFIYVGMTSRVGGLLAVAGIAAWLGGIGTGTFAVRAAARRPERR